MKVRERGDFGKKREEVEISAFEATFFPWNIVVAVPDPDEEQLGD